MFPGVPQPVFTLCLAAVLALVIGAAAFGAGASAGGGGTGEAAVVASLGYGPPPDASQACAYAWEAARRRARALAYEARQLSACAERRDLGDACLHAFWDVRNAQSDYESAVNEVNAVCA